MSDSNEDVSIPPVTVTTTTVIDKFVIKRIEIKIKESAVIMIELIDSTGNYAGTRYFTISGDDYANWGSDDDYIINWIKNNLVI
jgi:hypothetical protein